MSKYIGRVLYPERESRKQVDDGSWSYEKNKAFWAGAIDAKRTFCLITDINHYNYITGTVDELLWLQDNGYQFKPDENPKFPYVFAIPPENFSEPPFIKDYGNGFGKEGSKQDMYQRLSQIKLRINELRNEKKSSAKQATKKRPQKEGLQQPEQENQPKKQKKDENPALMTKNDSLLNASSSNINQDKDEDQKNDNAGLAYSKK